VSLDTAVQALVDAGAEFVIIGGWPAILHGSSFMTDLGGIDLLAEVSGSGTFDDVKAASVAVEAFGRQERREKDLRVLPELESLLEAEDP
jgi:hypothetical protein